MKPASRKAVTLVELLLVVVFLGVIFAVALPRFSIAAAKAGSAASTAQQIAAGIRYARSLALSNAASNQQGYMLRINGGGFEIVDLSGGSVVKTETLAAGVSCSGADDFRFSPLGNRFGDSDDLLVLAGGKTCQITVVSATGLVKCQQQ